MTDLHVTSPMMSGKNVLVVQTRLQALGFPPGALDGRYGPTTASAVKRFQTARKLRPTGIVDDKTAATLIAAAPSRAPGKPAYVKVAPGVLALHEALKHLGVKERPAGSNRNPFGAWFGVDGVPWCAIFVSYCFKVGAGVEICQGFKGAGAYPGKGCTYVPSVEAWLRSAGHWHGRTTPQPGDIAIFNWDGGQPDHVGIVEELLPDGSFHTIEGNTAVGNDSNGGQVMRRQRYLTQVDGFGRLS